MDKFCAIVEVKKDLYRKVLKSQNFEELKEARAWSRSFNWIAYRIQELPSKKTIEMKGEFSLIKF